MCSFFHILSSKHTQVLKWPCFRKTSFLQAVVYPFLSTFLSLRPAFSTQLILFRGHINVFRSFPSNSSYNFSFSLDSGFSTVSPRPYFPFYSQPSAVWFPSHHSTELIHTRANSNSSSLFIWGGCHCWLIQLSWNCLHPWFQWYYFSGLPSISLTISSQTAGDFFPHSTPKMLVFLECHIGPSSLPFLSSPCTSISMFYQPLLTQSSQFSPKFQIHVLKLLSNISSWLSSVSIADSGRLEGVIFYFLHTLSHPPFFCSPFLWGIPALLHVILVGIILRSSSGCYILAPRGPGLPKQEI